MASLCILADCFSQFSNVNGELRMVHLWRLIGVNEHYSRHT
jgi:hypothetical protein